MQYFCIMLSKEQLAEEKRKEAEYNKLFEMVISKTPFGQWYPFMIGASNMLTKNLPKRVGIDEDGRPLVVYKGEIGKALGTWARPTHAMLSQDLSRGDWKSTIQVLTGTVGAVKIKELQKQRKAKFFDISPKEVGEMHNKKIAELREKAKTNPQIRVTSNDREVEIEKEKYNYTPIIVGGLFGIAIITSIIVYVKYKN